MKDDPFVRKYCGEFELTDTLNNGGTIWYKDIPFITICGKGSCSGLQIYTNIRNILVDGMDDI